MSVYWKSGRGTPLTHMQAARSVTLLDPALRPVAIAMAAAAVAEAMVADEAATAVEAEAKAVDRLAT